MILKENTKFFVLFSSFDIFYKKSFRQFLLFYSWDKTQKLDNQVKQLIFWNKHEKFGETSQNTCFFPLNISTANITEC